MPPCSLEREEISTISPFGPFRERSTQRVTFNQATPWLSTEFEYRHVTFNEHLGTAETRNQLYQASFYGHNLHNDMEFKAGRIWTGTHQFRPVDGGSWYYPWGQRLSTTMTVGRLASVENRGADSTPGLFEGRLQYRFNDNTQMMITASRENDRTFSSVQAGYAFPLFTMLGEYQNWGATDSWRLNLQYYDGAAIDVTADYRLNIDDGDNSGIMRNIIGWEIGSFYLETGVGGQFFFNREHDADDSKYYEAFLTWGGTNPSRDSLSVGYTLETTVASNSRTLSGEAQRRISRNTTLGLDLASTRIDEGRNSIQHLGTWLFRRVAWGFWEVRLGMITSASDASLQRDVGFRAGYEF